MTKVGTTFANDPGKAHIEAMTKYVSRTLTYTTRDGPATIADDDVLGLSRPIVVLGEPGMGKSELLLHLSASPKTTLRSAAALVEYPDPKALVSDGQTLLIDGLDELAAFREGDPINRVIRKLIEAGWPRFVLSCRVADWRSAVARQEIAIEYGQEPLELHLDRLSEDDAGRFLAGLLPGGQPEAESFIEALEERGVSELYGNPLTLTLIGEIAHTPQDLLQSRAALYARACAIMWNERNDRQERSLLNQLDEASALDAAGAISASLILSGAQSVTRSPSVVGDGVVNVAEIKALPGGGGASDVLSSRLFSAGLEPGTMKPVHRSVAEYLGARWLSKRASTGLARARLMPALTVDGAPPASLRGLHAWLAHFSPELAPTIIDNDPYGVIRYGDADGISVEEARRLLQAFQRREEDNPYFRAEDWGRHTIRGLARVELSEEIRRAITNPETSFHLRSLLLEAIKGSAVVAALVPDLRAIMMTEDEEKYAYRERHVAASSLLEADAPDISWPEIVAKLAQSDNENSTRLALEIMDEAGYERFAPQLIAEAVLAHLGVRLSPELQERRSTSGAMYVASHNLPKTLIEAVLDATAESVPELADNAEYELRSELTAFVAHLIVRLIDQRDPEPAKLLAWLRVTPNRASYSSSDNEALQKYLRGAHEVRRAVQRILMMEERPSSDAWHRIWRLHEVHQSLGLSVEDIVYFLKLLTEIPSPSEVDVALWRELAGFVRRVEEGRDQILEAAQAFVRGDKAREEHLVNLVAPQPRPDWEIKEEQRRRAANAKKEASRAQHRKNYGENIAALERGEQRWIVPVARTYFALFSDTDRSLSPAERIADWLGPDLKEPALKGLYSVLDRDDLPTLDQIVGSYAQSRRWNFIHPMLASLMERINRGEDIDHLGLDRLISLRIAIWHEYLGERREESSMGALLIERIRALEAMEKYARLLVEPYLKTNAEHITGLHALLHSKEDRALMAGLARGWLTTFPDLHRVTEAELVDFLGGEGACEALIPLAHERLQSDLQNQERRFAWLTTLFLCDFNAGAAAIGAIDETRRDLFWQFRHRLGLRRLGDDQPVAVTPQQLEWVVRQFRSIIKVVPMPMGSSVGDTNEWDATRTMRHFIDRLAGDASDLAAELLQGLAKAAEDDWTDYLLSAADQQRSARRETAFVSVAPSTLRDIVQGGAPSSADDVRAVLLWALGAFQKELKGSDTDPIDKYYDDDGRPRDEGTCTRRLIEDLEPLLSPYGVRRVPERLMPGGKRADIVFISQGVELPVECKGQWNAQVWSGASQQLDALYLKDWRANDRGVYLVYWFGRNVAPDKSPRDGPKQSPRPNSSHEFKEALIERLPRGRRVNIAIEVLDLSR